VSAEAPFRIFVLALALALPLCAFAQTGTPPTGAPRHTWHFQLSGAGSWYENAYFANANTDTWSANGNASLGFSNRFRDGSYGFSAFGGAIYYPDIGDFNQPTYGGSFNLNWAASRRTTLTLGQGYSRTNTRYMTPADAAGLPLPTSGVNYGTSSLGLKQQLSQRWQLAVDTSFALHRYDDNRLVGGDQFSANASLQRHVGHNGGLYLSYGYSTVWFENDTSARSSHQALLGGHGQASRGVTFELAGGVGYVESTQSFYPSGRAGLTAGGRRTSLSLLYYRDFGQAWGYGRQMIGDLASATFTWSASRRLSFNAGYNFGYRRDPADESYTITSSIATAGFNWHVGGGVDLGAYYGWEHNDTKGLPVVEGARAGASLSYGVDWR
jgi:hypothetical protein